MSRERGFTLVEMMIVVAIIGLLAALAIPSFLRAREESRISSFVNALRVAADAFEMYAMNQGNYPLEVNAGVVPVGMEDYLRKVRWTEKTPLGGSWDWERESGGVAAGIAVVASPTAEVVFERVDVRLDDGDLTTGFFTKTGDRYTYAIVP